MIPLLFPRLLPPIKHFGERQAEAMPSDITLQKIQRENTTVRMHKPKGSQQISVRVETRMSNILSLRREDKLNKLQKKQKGNQGTRDNQRGKQRGRTKGNHNITAPFVPSSTWIVSSSKPCIRLLSMRSTLSTTRSIFA
jgi:hypothetical protein